MPTMLSICAPHTLARRHACRGSSESEDEYDDSLSFSFDVEDGYKVADDTASSAIPRSSINELGFSSSLIDRAMEISDCGSVEDLASKILAMQEFTSLEDIFRGKLSEEMIANARKECGANAQDSAIADYIFSQHPDLLRAEEASDKHLHGRLKSMGFSDEQIANALGLFGNDAKLEDVVEHIFAKEAAPRLEEKPDLARIYREWTKNQGQEAAAGDDHASRELGGHHQVSRRHRARARQLQMVLRCVQAARLRPQPPRQRKKSAASGTDDDPGARPRDGERPDKRVKLNCITTSSDRAARVQASAEAFYNDDDVDPQVFLDMKRANLVWRGRGILAPLEVQELEVVQGFDVGHTSSGQSPAERIKALGNAMQVHTVAWHLSLPNRYPGPLALLGDRRHRGGVGEARYSNQVPRNQRGLPQAATHIVLGDVTELSRERIEELAARAGGGFDLSRGSSSTT
ncbi:hypothetical protein SELMODRAFT_411052 [Selaginella moellendorffii]|uniref:Uncharacterized protein n=1 Tax=Selaginella moellendorffii TaxID=88036 RepID=D8RGF7_SELML|nr:hypothetical protein SELMODRAFT_411052 [Selaginella moellendorffii]